MHMTYTFSQINSNHSIWMQVCAHEKTLALICCFSWEHMVLNSSSMAGSTCIRGRGHYTGGALDRLQLQGPSCRSCVFSCRSRIAITLMLRPGLGAAAPPQVSSLGLAEAGGRAPFPSILGLGKGFGLGRWLRAKSVSFFGCATTASSSDTRCLAGRSGSCWELGGAKPANITGASLSAACSTSTTVSPLDATNRHSIASLPLHR